MNARFAMALLVHAMILLGTSVGGAISAARLGVGLSIGGNDEDVTRREAAARSG